MPLETLSHYSPSPSSCLIPHTPVASHGNGCLHHLNPHPPPPVRYLYTAEAAGGGSLAKGGPLASDPDQRVTFGLVRGDVAPALHYRNKSVGQKVALWPDPEAGKATLPTKLIQYTLLP
jgi:hypothetical protein